DPVDLGGRGDAEGVGQPAALHQLDVDVVGRPALEDAHGVGGAENALVGHHRHPAVAGDIGQALQVAGGDGLLHQLEVQALVLHLVQDADGLAGRPCLVGVDADADILPHRLADGGQAGGVQGGVHPYLDLEAVVAPGHSLHGVQRHLAGRVDADGEVRHQGAPGPAQQLVDRDLVQLAVKVPQG